ncbi:hypothetical protein OIO90_000389 [Microbotryomycetes sp. JL221]|nr:hypothetical protein OIO90_000389 [Microbotryomycetes sp. JL221]
MNDVADSFETLTSKKQTTSSTRTKRTRKGKAAQVPRSTADKVASRRQLLERTGYLQDFRALLRDSFIHNNDETSTCPQPQCIVCLGLGSVASSSKSQDQFVMLETLVDELQTSLNEPTRIFDPVFDQDDVDFFKQSNIQVLKTEVPRMFNIQNLPSSKEHLQAFNDLALQWLNHADSSNNLESSIWKFDDGSDKNEVLNDKDNCLVLNEQEKRQDDKTIGPIKQERDKVERALLEALSKNSLNE